MIYAFILSGGWPIAGLVTYGSNCLPCETVPGIFTTIAVLACVATVVALVTNLNFSISIYTKVRHPFAQDPSTAAVLIYLKIKRKTFQVLMNLLFPSDRKWSTITCYISHLELKNPATKMSKALLTYQSKPFLETKFMLSFGIFGLTWSCIPQKRDAAKSSLIFRIVLIN